MRLSARGSICAAGGAGEQGEAARERFDTVTPKARAEWVAWIEGAKRQATRERRVAQTVERLLAGTKRPSD